MAIIWDPQVYLNTGACDTEIPTRDGANPTLPFDFREDGSYAGGGNRWFFRCTDGIPGRGQYMQHQTVQNPSPPSTQSFFVIGAPTATSVNTDEIWYVGIFQRIKRINGLDVHLRSPGAVYSLDKNNEVGGIGQTLRWLFYTGTWGDLPQPVPAGKYTSHPANTDVVLNPLQETGYVNDYYPHNVGGYSQANPFLLNYDKWYAHVIELKAAFGVSTGHLKYYIDGTKVCEYLNIKTWNATPMNISGIRMGGTLAQNAYNSPPHLRGVDGWIVTDELATLQARGYFSDPSITTTNLVVGQRRLLI